MIDKIDVAEALVEELNAAHVPGLGVVLIGESGDGELLLQTWPDAESEESVDFLIRITRYRQPKVEA